MLKRVLLLAALFGALFFSPGCAQLPSQCNGMNITLTRDDVLITLDAVNCFRCDLPAGGITWTLDGVPITSTAATFTNTDGTTSMASTVNSYLVLTNPRSLVLPGRAGRVDILCQDANNDETDTRLLSPELADPTFDPQTVDEGGMLRLRCVNNVPNNVGTTEVFNPAGVSVAPVNYIVENVARDIAGNYSCVVTAAILANTTRTVFTTVTIQYAPEITPINSTTIRYDVALGSPLQLRCDYVGVPSPSLQWVQNNTNNLTSTADNIDILGGAEGDTSFSIVIDPVGRMDGGTFACVANNIVGSAMVVYSIRILIPPAPVTNLMVTNIDETNISLSWMTGFDGFTPITDVVVDITPTVGSMIADMSVGTNNAATITGLTPFTSHTFSIAVRNAVGLSDRVEVTASTLSLVLGMPIPISFEAGSSTNIVLTWNSPDFNSTTTDAPDFYIIEFYQSGVMPTNTTNVTAGNDPLTVNFTNLMKGTGYEATIVAHNVRGAGASTDILSVMTAVDPPGMPDNLVVEGAGATVLRVSFDLPMDDGGAKVTAVRVVIDTPTPFVSPIDVGAQTTFDRLLFRDNDTINGVRLQLNQSTTYTVRVSAANGQGFGENATVMATTQSIDQPQTIFDTPVPESGSETNSSAVLTWQFPGGTVLEYFVQYVLSVDGLDSGTVINVTVNGNDTSLLVENLLPGATYSFRVATINDLGMSEFSELGSVATLDPDPPMITSSHMNPVTEGTTVILTCIASFAGATYSWQKDGSPLPPSNMFVVNDPFLQIRSVKLDSAGEYTCITNTVQSTYVLVVEPSTEPPAEGIDQTVIIIVAAVGGSALVIFIVVVVVAVCCLCIMKKRTQKGNYGMKLKPVKSKERPNANWIETSTQFVPATGNQSRDDVNPSDRLAFDYSVDLQTHSSFNTLEKQRIQSTQPVDGHAPANDYEADSPSFQYMAPQVNVANGNEPISDHPPPSYVNASVV